MCEGADNGRIVVEGYSGDGKEWAQVELKG